MQREQENDEVDTNQYTEDTQGKYINTFSF